MTVIPITCDNCGAKYKLPETFTASQAKCQKCGSVIEVAKQRGSPASPGGAKPAVAARPATGAKPAMDRSTPQRATEPRSTRTPAREDARKGDNSPGAGPSGARSGRQRPAKKSKVMPLVLGIVGLLAIVVVVLLVKRG